MSMTGYKIIALGEMIEVLEEDRIKEILSSFSCPPSLDVEHFLHKSALINERQGISRTFLVYASYKAKQVLIGYFAIASKSFAIKHTLNGKLISKTMKKRIQRFGTYIAETKTYTIPAPLLGQLGKNFRNGYNNLITGDELLALACSKIQEGQRVLGGRFIYLECEDNPNLTEFYERNGFFAFAHRPLDRDERSDFSGDYLVQMLKYQ